MWWLSAPGALVEPGLAAGLSLGPGEAEAGAGEEEAPAPGEVLETLTEVGGSHSPGGELAQAGHAGAGGGAGPSLGHSQHQLGRLETAACKQSASYQSAPLPSSLSREEERGGERRETLLQAAAGSPMS